MRAARILAVIAVAFAAVGLVACRGTNSVQSDATTAVAQGSDTTASPSTEPALDPLHLQWGDTITVSGLKVTVEAPVDDTDNLGETEKLFLSNGDNRIFYCMVTIENVGTSAFDYSLMYFKLQDTDNFSYDPFGISSQPSLSSGNLPAGRTVKGAVAFELGPDSVPAFLDMQVEIFGSTVASWGS
jgi:hypothetical protein